MSIRNIVKVMNFHALIRVDNAKRKADKYRMMQKQLQQMMASILYNRNLILDASTRSERGIREIPMCRVTITMKR